MIFDIILKGIFNFIFQLIAVWYTNAIAFISTLNAKTLLNLQISSNIFSVDSLDLST